MNRGDAIFSIFVAYDNSCGEICGRKCKCHIDAAAALDALEISREEFLQATAERDHAALRDQIAGMLK